MQNSGQKEILSIVVPVCNEEDTIQIFFDAIQEVSLDILVEFLFVDDGSTDGTLSLLRNLSKKNSAVSYISFSRNFGKDAAIYAGMKQSRGDFVAIMDVDLQDPPELLPEMLASVKTGKYDSVGTRRSNRSGEGRVRSWFSVQFYKLINKMSETQLVYGVRDFRVMNRQMVNGILQLCENQRFSKGIFAWVGFRTKYIPYENHKRVAGNSSWTFVELFKYAVEGIVSFSTVPLTIVALIGLITFFLSVMAGIFIVIRALVSNTSVAGWPSMVTIILFIGGLQMLSIGVIGRYLSAIFIESKHRPIYIAKEIHHSSRFIQ
ncbi:glycosyltransferase family 2 protein [Fructobacillus sp. M158]|uniref:glycosyltransferase family 2 protein n=1 Tax=Fructobacillus parabroussonetiae TaxID=2713174 RepID=UPI00200B9BEB|nr:glycosyltransferase family 2 protein [Fructobacillus parabroussonetiae]MCK8616838.1 glycosyltransferase family 2 protein [Fructobacillus parabroussonetiae]